MIKKLIPVFIIVFTSMQTFGQANSEIVIPVFTDKYSAFVKQLEAGQTDINYREFRESFIESEQFRIASDKGEEFDSLKRVMYSLMAKKENEAIIKITKQLLSIDYTSMIAHKILRQTYQVMGDTANAAKYKTIQFGLLNSIVKNGDGKTCATAWPVIQVDEEYFILQMLGVDVQKQSIENNGGLCDKMEVKTETGEKRTYYFETSKVFQGYKKLGI